jgi:hypothetical protein
MNNNNVNELPLTLSNVNLLKLKKYNIILVNMLVLSERNSPILWHKSIDLKEKVGKMIIEARIKNIRYVRADKGIAALRASKTGFTSVVVFGKVCYNKLKKGDK